MGGESEGGPGGAGVTQRHHLGGKRSRPGLGVPLPGKGMEEREGGAMIPVPRGADTGKFSRSRNPAMWGEYESVRGKEGASPTARMDSPGLMSLRAVPEDGGRTRRKQQTHTLFI